MNELGSVCLMLALVLAAYSAVVSVLGALRRDARLVRSGEAAGLAVAGLVSLAMVALWVLLTRSEFSNHYVWGHSNRALSLFYKVAALWAGNDGSLLLWHGVLIFFAALVILLNRHRNRELMPWVVAVLMVSSVFFGLINIIAANPFQEIVAVHADDLMVPFAPPDGRGLNPLLHHPAMVIHPPILFLGYVGFIVPFAFAIAALITGRLDDGPIRSSRRWTLVAWMFLGSGILLGGRWAYVELGWGGYWAWDPVENASLIPWLTATAFLHSVMMQEKRGMMKVWNVVLICATYFLAVFGTFMTRSGNLTSVHAFANSTLAGYFVVYLCLMLIGTVALIRYRLPLLQSEHRLESLVSRESSFLFNNLAFSLACLVVLFGTLFPKLSLIVRGQEVNLLAPWFNKVMPPLGLFLLFLTGAGPLIPWRRSSWKSLRRVFLLPAVVGLATALVTLALGTRDGYALVTFGLCGFVAATIVVEFARGARVRARRLETHFFGGLMDLMHRNHRRYGGYLAHLAVVLLFVGFAGKAFVLEHKQPLGVGDSFELAGYTFRCDDVVEGDDSDPNYVAERMEVALLRGDRQLASLRPERRIYLAGDQQQTTEVSRYSSWREDVYTIYTRVAPQAPAEIQIWINPLVRWVWMGGILMAAGTLSPSFPTDVPSLARRPARPVRSATKSVPMSDRMLS